MSGYPNNSAPPYSANEIGQAPPQQYGSPPPEKGHDLHMQNMGAQQQYQQGAPQGAPQQQYQQSPQPSQQHNQPVVTPGQGFQTAVPITALGPGPAPIDCPACGMRQMTRVQFENGNTVYAWAAGLCFCFCLGCIPFCISSLKDVAHFCGHCGVRVATFHRSGRTEQHVHA